VGEMPIEVTDKTPRKGQMARRRGAVGRPNIDVQRLGRAIAGPGIDTRYWLAAGTVGHRDDRGTFVTNDTEAIYADRLGPVVSVRLEANVDDRVITARWQGIGCGRYGFMLFPLRPGDEVVVAIPEGDLNSAAITIVAVLPNQTARIPQDWNNDRVLFDLNVPFEVKAPAIRMTSGSLVLNDRQVNFSPEDI